MNKPKTCPFCKHPARIIETPVGSGISFRIECPHCGTVQPSIFRPRYMLRFYGEREKALKQIIGVWNRRDKCSIKNVRIK
jgi:hypothetical protein